MSELPYMPFYVGDYLLDTTLLDLEEHGAYCLLLFHYWKQNYLENDEKKLRKLLNIHGNKCKRILKNILPFFEVKDGFLINKRMEKELQKRGKRSEHARAAARARWMPGACPEQCPNDAHEHAISELELEQELKDNSEANASDASASSSPSIDPVWHTGLDLLVGKGTKEQTARTLLGRWVKEHGEETVAFAIDRALQEQPVEPKAFIAGVLKSKPKRGQPKNALDQIQEVMDEAERSEQAGLHGGGGLSIPATTGREVG